MHGERRHALECQYNTDLFDAATVRRWLDAYEALLRAASPMPSAPSGKLSIVSPQDAAALAACIRRRARSMRPPTRQSFRGPGRAPRRSAPPCAATERRWTYADLAARANAIAGALRARGIGRGALVGLCLERDADMVASVMGVLAGGAGYVPLDPGVPARTPRFHGKDAQLALLLTQQSLAGTDRLAGRSHARDRIGESRCRGDARASTAAATMPPT